MSYATLIIDDEATLAKNMKLYLERYGYDVRIAGSAEEGLEQLDEFLPEVVILDFDLPGIDGFQTLADFFAYESTFRGGVNVGSGNFLTPRPNSPVRSSRKASSLTTTSPAPMPRASPNSPDSTRDSRTKW